MDNLSWDHNPSIFLRNENTIPPTIWSNQYDNFSESDTDYSIISGKVELNEGFFNSSLELQADSFNLDRVNEMVGMLAPDLDSMNNNLDLDFLQRQEALMLAADSVLSSHQLSSFPPTIRPKISMDPSGSLTENFGTSQELQVFTDIKNGEDGISAIFPSGKNVHNLSCSGNFSSSGESEAGSQGSSQAEPSKVRPNSKRKSDYRHSCNFLPSSTSSTLEGGFQFFFEKSPKSKKLRSEKQSGSSNIDFWQENNGYEPDTEAIAQVKEMIYRAAALRPVSLVLEETAEKPKRKNVKISSDPQTVAARHRRERISERLRVLQRLVPGGTKMDTASMLDEAANYLKFLKSQVSALETLGNSIPLPRTVVPFNNQGFPMQTTIPPHL